ncbi:MAG: LysM peptidoglycan-binding domain-containing protein [Anaerolineales bacterium]|nr:LysM peptidoglycan-binding domain-containing protein [Anaerolineales bacterium]
MPDSGQNASEVIDNYRKRRERIVPFILGGLAVVLLVVGIFLVIMWLSGDNPPALPGFLGTDTPTPTATSTPMPPTATPTITLTPEPTLSPTPAGPVSYFVEQGDSLSTIAAAYEVDVYLLMAYNNIEDPNSIYVGQEIIIPGPDAELPTSTPLPEVLYQGQQIEYRVQPNDTLESIAAQFNSTAEAIAELNEIEDLNSIGVGVVLLIPVNLVTPTPTSVATATQAS